MAYPANYRYTREHEWIALSGSIGTIGITDYAQKSLREIVYAELLLGKTIFDKYKIEDVERFMKEKFSDLGKTYLDSGPGERRVLLGSICPTGLAWRYSGLSNQQFSPQYQAILDVREDDFASSTPERSRTPNPFVRSEVLYPLSYRRKLSKPLIL